LTFPIKRERKRDEEWKDPLTRWWTREEKKERKTRWAPSADLAGRKEDGPKPVRIGPLKKKKCQVSNNPAGKKKIQ